MEKTQINWAELYQQIVKSGSSNDLSRDIPENTQIKKFSLLKDYKVEYSYKAGIRK